MSVVGVTFSAWRGDRPVDLAQVLKALGPAAGSSSWTLRDLEVALSPSAAHLQGLSDRMEPVIGTRLAELAAATPVQVIEGELEACEPGRRDPWIKLRAVDGRWWDVISSNEEVLARIQKRFPDAAPLPPEP